MNRSFLGQQVALKHAVPATLQGRAPAPEHCLDAPHGTVDLSRIPPGRHRFAVRDEASGDTDDINIVVVQ